MTHKQSIITSNDKAPYLRRNATPAENILWQHLRRNAMGVHFRRQCPIGEYILDFYCNKLKLCIELDGSKHDHTFEYDDKRTSFLNSLGITVLRYDNSVVFNNCESIKYSIRKFIQSPRFIPGNCRNLLL